MIFFPRSPFGLQVWCFGEPESIYFNGDMYLGVKSKGHQYDFPLVWPHDWNRQKLAPAAIFADHFQLGAPVMFPAEGACPTSTFSPHCTLYCGGRTPRTLTFKPACVQLATDLLCAAVPLAGLSTAVYSAVLLDGGVTTLRSIPLQFSCTLEINPLVKHGLGADITPIFRCVLCALAPLCFTVICLSL